MKINDTYDVVVPSEEGNVVMTFKRMFLNDALAAQIERAKLVEGTPEQIKENYKALFSSLVKISGLERSDGSEIPAEDIRELKLDVQTLMMLAEAHTKQIVTPGAAEKKDSPPE